MLRHVLIDTQESLDEFAARFRKLLDLPDQNASAYIRDQRRDGANRGGLYYYFEGQRFHFELMRNSGVSSVREDHDAPFYLWIHTGDAVDNEEAVDTMVRECIRILNSAGIAAEGCD
ncbi:MAG TPA: hypothetical protein VFS19_06960 [Planctomycetota bacterium]|nr:hypothetical protein [Planctomycetota bacterium]